MRGGEIGEEARMEHRSRGARCANAATALVAVLLSGLIAPASYAQSYKAPRTPDGKPNINGIWQTLNSANWDLQEHAAGPGVVVALGAVGAAPAGLGVVEGGEIPYLPERGEEERELREPPDRRSGDQVLPARRSAGDLHALSVSNHSDAASHPDGL